MRFDFFWTYRIFYLEGALTTLGLALCAVVLGVILGLIFALMRLSKFAVLRAIAGAYIEFVRGTPMLVQIMIVYYGLNAMGIALPAFVAGIITLAINSGAYVAEIIRAGIQAVDRGQGEAGAALAMTPITTMRYIILPQAFRNILPALVNEFITVIKESSIVSVIAIGDLMYKATRVRGITFLAVEPYIIAALIYFIITFTLSKLLGRLERRLWNSDRNKGSEKTLRRA